MSAYSTSISSNYPTPVLPSPTPGSASRSPFSTFASDAAVVGGPVDPKYLREKIATAFLVIYSVSGFVSLVF
jgi:hypothetical protein